MTQINVIDVDKIGSATSPLGLMKTVAFVSSSEFPIAGDVVVVRALTDSATYNMLELVFTASSSSCRPGVWQRSIPAICCSACWAGAAR
jgi:uncharacterized membrane protein